MADPISLSIDAGVARVMLNRPQKMNAVNPAMFEGILELGDKLAADRSLRAVVLSGAGDNFCAGIDVSTFASAPTGNGQLDPLEGKLANIYQQAACAWRSMPVPVIAALRGTVFGAGLQISLGADIRIAAPDVRLSVMEIKWGLVPDMGVSVTLPPLLRYDTAAELAWTGRLVSATEAAELGLVTRVAEDSLAAAEAAAAAIAAQSPDAVRAAKRLLQVSYGDRDATLLRLEAEMQAAMFAGDNHREAVAANLEKRPPNFGASSV